jgi:prepilin-type processing-associated H-X9-DG protein
MQPRSSNQRNRALTLVEVLVIITVLAIVAAVILPGLSTNRIPSTKIACVNNLHQIGTAFKIWPPGEIGTYPMQVSVTRGGAKELVTTGNVAAVFFLMSNELVTPRILVCPADSGRIAATNFFSDFNNGKISYFIGLDADEDYPQRILSGDDNFAIGRDQIKSGLLELSTNTSISWTAARHKFAGNIGFADGSVQQVGTTNLQPVFQQTGLATNRLAIP